MGWLSWAYQARGRASLVVGAYWLASCVRHQAWCLQRELQHTPRRLPVQARQLSLPRLSLGGASCCCAVVAAPDGAPGTGGECWQGGGGAQEAGSSTVHADAAGEAIASVAHHSTAVAGDMLACWLVCMLWAACSGRAAHAARCWSAAGTCHMLTQHEVC